VGSGVFGEGESRFKVLSEEFSLFNGSEDGAIDFSLGLSSSSDLVFFSLSLFNGTSGEESFFGLLGLLNLNSVEGFVVDGFSLNARDVDLSGGGDDGGLVDSSEGNTVKLEGTSDQEEARLELSQEDDSLALESTDQENQDGTRDDVSSESVSLGGLSGVSSDSGGFSGVPLRDSDGSSFSSTGGGGGFLDVLWWHPYCILVQ
jgi:hypothetical protein